MPAFRAWLAQRPVHQPTDGPGPLYLPEYRSADLARSAKLDAAADELYQEGTAAKSHDDKYILSTVFFAAVLFFAGISLRLDWRPLRIAVLGMALALLAGGSSSCSRCPWPERNLARSGSTGANVRSAGMRAHSPFWVTRAVTRRSARLPRAARERKSAMTIGTA